MLADVRADDEHTVKPIHFTFSLKFWGFVNLIPDSVDRNLECACPMAPQLDSQLYK